MTDMVSGAPQTAGDGSTSTSVGDGRPQVIRHGLTMERVYTTAGVHPYDEVTWERRDVVQTNWKTGDTVFEQRGVEFPDFWSVISSTIVTTKYFRGAVGTDVREWSLRQLIDRVVSSYRAAGEQNGYFASPDDAEIFEHELTWMLLHQVFSFNSPVWFNVGTPAPQQVSACFILAVDDSMTSILNWYKEEGMIFKGGSGAGLNLSRIRSSKELLSSGGTASGPVSFMRGADASAGTIKSGGATRRAAKMVVLDVDHPDIEEFIETKAREEDKIRALRDAGFDMDLGGKDITSVQYQNANNSVRVSDEFMRAVEEKDEFGLRARTDGSVIERVDAKGLFDKIAQAAWGCADPGIQYDDTINDWHTTPESGRITASNPCFTADTRVHTDKGLIRFDEMLGRANAGEEFQVYTHDATNPDAPAQQMVLTSPEAFLITGHNPILRLRFSSGMELRCTPGHRIWTTNRGYVEAEHLNVDDRVLALDLPTPAVNASWALPVATRAAGDRTLGERHDPVMVPEVWNFDLAHYLGWLVGDGSTSSTISTIYGCAEDRDEILPRHQDFVERFNAGRPIKVSEQSNGTAQLRLARGSFRRFLTALGVTDATGPHKTVPAALYEAPPDIVAEFLRGLFDADGTVVRNDSKGSYAGLGSASRSLLIGVQRLLATFGISSRMYKVRDGSDDGYIHTKADGSKTRYRQSAGYDLRITSESLDVFAAEIGFTLSRKAQLLIDVVTSRSAYRGDRTVRLVERSDEGIELTYNLSEPRNHSYVANGIVVRNCSEYMHLDNSSCNLASINLLKFLRDDDTFDAATFEKVVETVITAMDISICFADFPTEAIGDTTRKFRQLGIGYANLGALLMAAGLPYDSDGGRALAASITSLMTGAAYKRSAELAGVVGPYEGYERNAEPHKRVMRKHAAANDAIRAVTTVDKDVQAHATQAWADVVRLGEELGFRNSQSSVLAPTGTIGLMMDCDTTGIEPDLALVKFKKLVGGGSLQIVNQTVPRALRKLGYAEETVEAIVEHISQHGNVIDAPGLKLEHYNIFDCAMGARTIAPMGHVRMMAAVQPFLSGAISKCVTGDSLVATKDGLVRIESWWDGEAADSFRDLVVEVASLGGTAKTDAFYYGGLRPTRRVILRSGHRVVGTPNHRVLVAGDHGMDWRQLSELTVGDYVAVRYGDDLWSETPASLRHVTVSPRYGSQKVVTVPEEMSEDLAFLLGAYASEGHTTLGNWTVTITNSQRNVLERVQAAWQSVFGLSARIVEQPGKCPGVLVASKTIVEFLRGLGCGERAANKRIPDVVLRSPKSMVLAFLQGLALDAYVTVDATCKWAICVDSRGLLDDLQAVLTNLGIVHGRIGKLNHSNGKTYDEVYACGAHAIDMIEMVPFLEADKASRAAELTAIGRRQSPADVVPGISGRDLYVLLPSGRSGRSGAGTSRHEFRFLLDTRTQHVSRRTLERVAAVPGVNLPQWLRTVLCDNLHFTPVAEVIDDGPLEVYDVSVPSTHAFVANGIVNHNTVNMPESATVEEVEEIYHQGWKLGLKALAIYRDNCKVGQPLSDAKGTSKDNGVKASPEPVTETRIEYRPTRKRLPKHRPATTTSFTVGGAEGYMTASRYPDDGLGEIFLKMSKQGSTLAGMMDAFSIAVSIGLQYGVPLDTYVQKFVNMRFDPAGLTDDPDVRMAQSIMDYIFRRLALDYMPFDERAALGIYTADERKRYLETGSYEELDDESDASVRAELDTLAQSAPVAPHVEAVDASEGAESEADEEIVEHSARPVTAAHSSTELLEALQGTAADAPLCLTCGTKMRPAGSCYVCEGCGATSGCS